MRKWDATSICKVLSSQYQRKGRLVRGLGLRGCRGVHSGGGVDDALLGGVPSKGGGRECF